MSVLSDREKAAHLLGLFRLSNLPPALAAAREVYEDNLSALAALRLARSLGHPEIVHECRRFAALHRSRWRRCREKIIVMKFEK